MTGTSRSSERSIAPPPEVERSQAEEGPLPGVSTCAERCCEAEGMGRYGRVRADQAPAASVLAKADDAIVNGDVRVSLDDPPRPAVVAVDPPSGRPADRVRRGPYHEDRMPFQLIPTSPSMAEEGFDLFVRRYDQAARAQPLIPPLAGGQPARLRARVERAFSVGGVAAVRDGRMVGYMIASPIFEMRGLGATLIPEHGHAVTPGEEVALYAPLYARAIEERVREGAQLHLIGRFAGDDATRRALEDLGFGAVVDERLRDLTDVPGGTVDAPDLRIESLPPDVRWDEVAEIAAEHAAYYQGSPIFLAKDLGLDAARDDLDGHRRAGDRLFVARGGGAIVAYLIVGACAGQTEGRLLAGTRTAQLRSAYARPASRRRGIGSALLQRAVAWARDAGYQRLFVEHETANLEGRAFWRRHFAPFLRFSMRYVQRTL